MRIHSIYMENFGPFPVLNEVKIGNLATIIGQNDVGKSHILRALDVFLGSSKIQEQNVCATASANADVVIEVTFDELPRTIELESNVVTSFQEEKLLDSDGFLRLRKKYSRTNLTKPETTIITYDFDDDKYAGLPILKEEELNSRCSDLSISAPRSGAGTTNKGKREAIRSYAADQSTPLVTRGLVLSLGNVQKLVNSILPDFIFFKNDTPLEVGQTLIQSWFKPFVKAATMDQDVSDIRSDFEDRMLNTLQEEVNKIYRRLSRHTDAFTQLSAKPSFQWDKAVKLDVTGTDEHGTVTLLKDRGSGMQRLFMVSYFEYVAEEKSKGEKDIVYGIEEPENCLHPGLQRELVSSFRNLVNEGFQVILTSHSPVFAGTSPMEDLVLITRDGGVASSTQHPELSLEKVAGELGVGPSDQLFGYGAIAFVEGPDDESFFKAVASKLKASNNLQRDFDDVNLGFIITGGDNLKHWVDKRVMRKLSSRFCLVIDSDRTHAEEPLQSKKLSWKTECEEDGGLFMVLRKRSIENYIHSDALTRRGIVFNPYDDFTDMKSHIGRKDVWRTITEMTADEILEMDRYEESGVTHHELKEIVEQILSLC